MADKFLNIAEIMGRADFGDLLKDGLNPVLIEGTEMEVSEWKDVFQSINMQKYSMTFYAMGGLTVGRIVEGQEIPFVNLGTGRVTVTAEEYGVRCGYTHQMIRDGEIDVMRYTTQELGRAYARCQCEAGFGALVAGAGFVSNYDGTTNTLLKAIRYALKKGQLVYERDTKIPRPVAYDTLVINPQDLDALVPTTYGGDATIPTGLTFDPATGKVTGLLGLRVIVTPWVATGTSVLCKAKDGLLYLEREGLSLDRTERFETAAEEVRLLSAFTFAILKSQNVVKIYKDNSTTSDNFAETGNAPMMVSV